MYQPQASPGVPATDNSPDPYIPGGYDNGEEAELEAGGPQVCPNCGYDMEGQDAAGQWSCTTCVSQGDVDMSMGPEMGPDIGAGMEPETGFGPDPGEMDGEMDMDVGEPEYPEEPEEDIPPMRTPINRLMPPGGPSM